MLETVTSISNIYNSLPDIMEADERFKASSWETTLDSLSDVIRRHRLQTVFGIRLLHKHNQISSDEFMVEREERFDDKDCLVTSIKNTIPDRFCFPNSWALFQGRMEPLEYSEDADVDISRLPSNSVTDFFAEFGQHLCSNQATSLLGPCVIRRQFFDRRLPSQTFLVETTDELRHANVLRFTEDGEFEARNLIDATWVVRDPTVEEVLSGCKTRCASSGCIVQSACVRDNAGDHSPRQHHDRGNHAHQHYE